MHGVIADQTDRERRSAGARILAEIGQQRDHLGEPRLHTGLVALALQLLDAVGDGVADSRIGERVVLKPIVSCGECASCREGAINHCATGRLVGRGGARASAG